MTDGDTLPSDLDWAIARSIEDAERYEVPGVISELLARSDVGLAVGAWMAPGSC